MCGGDGQCGASFNDGFIVSNAFVTELNPAGSGIIYSTFFGYYENVKGQAIAVDANGNAYLTGSTTENFTPTVTIVPPKLPPPPFPIIGAFQPVYGGGSTNAFVSVIDATGKTVLYSSYLGGNIEDVGNGISVMAMPRHTSLVSPYQPIPRQQRVRYRQQPAVQATPSHRR